MDVKYHPRLLPSRTKERLINPSHNLPVSYPPLITNHPNPIMSFSFPFLSSSKPTPFTTTTTTTTTNDEEEESHLGNHPRNGTKITRYEAPPISSTIHIDASNPPRDLLHPNHLIMDISSSSASGSGGSGSGNGNGNGSGASRNGSASSSPDTTKRRSTTLPEPTGLGMVGRLPRYNNNNNNNTTTDDDDDDESSRFKENIRNGDWKWRIRSC